MREREVEAYLKRRVLAVGGLERKLKWGTQRNAPDRFIAVYGTTWLVEVKRPGEKPNKAQAREHQRLRLAGVKIAVVDTFQAVDTWLEKARPSRLEMAEYIDLPDGSVIVAHPSIPPHRWDKMKKAYVPIEYKQDRFGTRVDIKI